MQLHTLAAILVLAGGRLIDGFGGPPLENAVVVIDGNTIREVGPESAVKIPADAKVIDTNGYTMMPGLMDMHVHLMILGHGAALDPETVQRAIDCVVRRAPSLVVIAHP